MILPPPFFNNDNLMWFYPTDLFNLEWEKWRYIGKKVKIDKYQGHYSLTIDNIPLSSKDLYAQADISYTIELAFYKCINVKDNVIKAYRQLLMDQIRIREALKGIVNPDDKTILENQQHYVSGFLAGCLQFMNNAEMGKLVYLVEKDLTL